MLLKKKKVIWNERETIALKYKKHTNLRLE